MSAMLVPSTEISVERGPDWLFVKLNGVDESADAELAGRIWRLLEEHFTYRAVLEMDEVERLNSSLLGQLVHLHKRVSTHGGVLRLCGLSDENQRVLSASRLAERFPQFSDRRSAVLAHTKPR